MPYLKAPEPVRRWPRLCDSDGDVPIEHWIVCRRDRFGRAGGPRGRALVVLTGRTGARALDGEVQIVESQLAKFDRELHASMAGANGPAKGDAGLCLELARRLDVAPGHHVVLTDQAGSVIGESSLGPAELVTEGPSGAGDDVIVCRLPFRVDDIRPTGAVTIAIGTQQRATFRGDELEARSWHVELPLGS